MTRFVDVHVHPPAGLLAADGYRPYLSPEDIPPGPSTFEELADYYREREGVALVHAFDAGSIVGAPALTNRQLAELIAPHTDVLVGLACVDPHRGEAAVVAVHAAFRMGLRGLFLHPAAQRFDPTGRRITPLWEIAEEAGLPVVAHCGTTVMGAGRPGGAGVALGMADPMKMDTVAASHPDLEIVLAGVTPPWEESAVAVAVHKGNVHLALSGGPPGMMGRCLRDAVTGSLWSKAMCGTGFPFLNPDDWLEDWRSLNPSAEADEAVRVGNATALFGL